MKAITVSARDLNFSGSTCLATTRNSKPARMGRTMAITALDPTMLDENSLRSVEAFLYEGQSRNTLRAVEGTIRYWKAWFEIRYQQHFRLPVTPETVIQFIVDHLEHIRPDGSVGNDLPLELDRELVRLGVKSSLGARSLNTVTHRIAMLSSVHRMKKLSSPAKHENVLELIRRIRRGYAARGIHATRKTALTKPLLQALLDTCDDSLTGIRDRALLLFAFASGGRRRSEVAEAIIENLNVVSSDGYSYRLGRSKTDQTGEAHTAGAYKPVFGAAASALKNWLAVSGVKEGFIFRRIRRRQVTSEGLSGDAIALIVKRHTAQARLRGDFSGHSLRSGFVTEAGRQRVPLGEVMAMTGHRSAQTALRYFQPGEMQSTLAARIFD